MNNEIVKCEVYCKNMDEFILYATEMNKQGKSIEDILKFNFQFDVKIINT